MFVQACSAAPFIQLVTENYPPWNYPKDGEIVGTSVELVKKIMVDLQIDYHIAIYPWKRAYNLALTEPSTCVFTTAKTKLRTPLFQWVEPLAIDRSVLVAPLESTLSIRSIEDAKKYRIGLQSGFAEQSLLIEMGFSQNLLIPYTHFDQLLQLLYKKRVPFVAMGEPRLTDLQVQGHRLKSVLVLKEIALGLACNLQMDEALVSKMQQSLNKIIVK